MSGAKRNEKLAKQIQRDLSDIFLQHTSQWFNNEFITISKVISSGDLGVAKIYLSAYNSKDKNSTLELVQSHQYEIRRELASKLKNEIRRVPELIYFIDDSLDYVEKMEKIFANINHKK